MLLNLNVTYLEIIHENSFKTLSNPQRHTVLNIVSSILGPNNSFWHVVKRVNQRVFFCAKTLNPTVIMLVAPHVEEKMLVKGENIIIFLLFQKTKY